MNITEIIAALRDKTTWCVLARQKADKALFNSAADALEALLKCCDIDANGNPVTRGSTLYLYPGNDVTREPMTLKVPEQVKYCWHNSIEQAQAAINAAKEKL